jgi:head-tail adaptor
MRAGILKEIITILTPIVTKNKFGEQTQEWK